MNKSTGMSRYRYSVILLAVLYFNQAFTPADTHKDPNASYPVNAPAAHRIIDHTYPAHAPANPYGHDLTVSYSIELKSRKSNTGIGETYNGGVETVFANDQQVRLRLVSLMRMQSILLLPDQQSQRKVVIFKESGKDRYKCYLTPEEWKAYNQKYQGVICNITNDTMTILNYSCKKAVLTLKNRKQITVYFTSAIQNQALIEAEPMFSCIPGLVLKYEYGSRKKNIIYTATSISNNAISPDVFAVPGNEFPVRKYVTEQPPGD